MELFFNMIGSSLAGVISGVIVLLFQRHLDKRNKRILNNELINTLSPTMNFNKIYELFGQPQKISRDIIGNKELFSVVYRLSNAAIKVSSFDKEQIFSITVFSSDKKIDIPYLDYWINEEKTKNSLGLAKINKKIIKDFDGELIGTMRDGFHFMLGLTIPAPDYRNIYYFCQSNFDETKSELEGRKIIGFSIADYMLNDENIELADLLYIRR
ncbi:hypothetical protein [Neisseria sp. CCUG12390]|uniref:hypothetical protein n=1 Tax=Neisseria sp. CCUG12390 TaxID=3392035 RepID=UPI003A1034B3